MSQCMSMLSFKSQECFGRHKQNIGQECSVCASLVKYPHCNSVVKRGEMRADLHHCGQSKCKVCKEYVDPKHHRCYMQPVRTCLVMMKPMMKHLKVAIANCCVLTLSVVKSTVVTNQIYAWFRMRLVMSGYSKGIIHKTSYVKGCLQKGTRDV